MSPTLEVGTRPKIDILMMVIILWLSHAVKQPDFWIRRI